MITSETKSCDSFSVENVLVDGFSLPYSFDGELRDSGIFFFLSEFSFTDTDDSHDSRGREGTIFYSTLPLPPTHEHWDIYLQLRMWDDYHVFLIATLAFTRLLFDEIYHLIELPSEWLIDDAMFVCLLDELILGFCFNDLTLETCWFDKVKPCRSATLLKLSL